MMKTYNKVLDNGLRVFIVQNKKKNRCGAKIVIMAGGHNINYVDKNGKKKEIKKGIAHFLEHYLIEKSIYGNLGKYFADESMSFNGVTYPNRTEFYFSTVHDFKEALVRLIKLVNEPQFNEIDIEEVKKPVIEEIKRSLDNKNRQDNKKVDEAFYYNYYGDITLGDIETIENLTIEDLKEFHNCFYSTNKQIISIFSKYDIKEIKKIINKEYPNNKNNIKTELPIEPVKVKKKNLVIVDPSEDEYLRIRFKIGVEGYSNWDIYLLEGYMYYFSKMNFSIDSKLFKELRNKNYTMYGIETGIDYDKYYNLLFFEIVVYTSEFDKCLNSAIGEGASEYLHSSYAEIMSSLEKEMDGQVDDMVDNLNSLIKLFKVATPNPNFDFGTYEANCEDVSILHTIYMIIVISAPILAIVLGSLDYAKAVIAADEKKAQEFKKQFPKRLIALVLLILVPFIIHFILSIFPAAKDTLMYCVINGS